MADEINCILEEFQINTEVVAATVDNASNMDVALKNLKLLKVGCFAHPKPGRTEGLQHQCHYKVVIYCSVAEEVLHG